MRLRRLGRTESSAGTRCEAEAGRKLIACRLAGLRACGLGHQAAGPVKGEMCKLCCIPSTAAVSLFPSFPLFPFPPPS